MPYLRLCMIAALMAACSSSTISARPDPNVDYVKLADAAWQAGRRDDSIRYRELCWRQRPEGWRLNALIGAMWWDGRYQAIIDFLDKVPRAQWYPANGTDVYRMYARSLSYTGRPAEAFKIVLEAIAKNDREVWQDYHVLLTRRGGLAAHFMRDRQHLAFIERMFGFLKAMPQANMTLVNDLFYHCTLSLPPTVDNKDWRTARRLTEIMHTLAHTWMPAQSPKRYDAEFFQRAIKWKAETDGKRKPDAVTMRWLGLYFMGADAQVYPEGGGTPRHVRRQFTREEVAETIRRNREDAAVVTLEYEYLSRGGLILSFDYKPVEATIRRVNHWHIVHDETTPHPGKILYEASRDYDGIIQLYPSELIDGPLLGGCEYYMLLPYTASGPYRGGVWLGESSGWGGYSHEIFHNIESLFGHGPAHAFLEEHRAIWPARYRAKVASFGRDLELAYYEDIFEQKFNPQGFAALQTRTRYPMSIQPAGYAKLESMFKAVPFERVRQANERFVSGEREREAGRRDAAMAHYRAALALYPGMRKAYYELAMLTLHNSTAAAVETARLYEDWLDRFGGIHAEDDWGSRHMLVRLFEIRSGTRQHARILDSTVRYKQLFAGSHWTSMLDWFHDRAMEATGRAAEVIPKADGQGRLVDCAAARGLPPGASLYNVTRTGSGSRAVWNFNGDQSWIDLGARAWVGGRSAFTLEARITSQANGKRQLIVQQRSQQGFDGEYMLYLRPDGRPELFVYGEGVEACTLAGPASLQDGREHHLVAVRAADGRCTLYVDGRAVATQAARPVAMIPLVVYIGGDLRDTNAWFLGTVRRVQIWQRALDATEIRRAAGE